jgi:hypothetical protein
LEKRKKGMPSCENDVIKSNGLMLNGSIEDSVPNVTMPNLNVIGKVFSAIRANKTKVNRGRCL